MKSSPFLFNLTRILIIFLLCNNFLQAQPRLPAIYSGSVPKNYTRTWDIMKPGVDQNSLSSELLKDVKQATQYFDGLGRPLEAVIKQGSLQTSGGLSADLVSPSEYDEYGRERYKWLPFVSTTSDGNFKFDPFQQQAAFMASQYGSQGETYFYSQTNFESSPLNRVDKTMAAGNSWVGAANGGRGTSMKYWVNATADDVKKWIVTDVPNALGTYSLSSNSYLPGELFKSVMTDEHGKQVVEFKDKEDKVILKKVQLSAADEDGNGKNHDGWLCTYYIYDDFNNLRCVIQPEGVKALSVSSWAFTTTLLDEQCFRYEYDAKKRMIKKKVPGAGEVWMVYDARDRLVLTQDANLRNGTPKKWMYTLYDDLNRPTSTGLWENSQDRTYHHGQAATSIAYPNLSGQVYAVLTRTFYDNYDWIPTYGYLISGTRNSSYDNYLLTPTSSSPYPQAHVQSFQTKGLVTGVWVNMLGTIYGFSTSIIYDDKGRVIQKQSNNLMGGLDIESTQYSWAGQPLLTIQKNQLVHGAIPQTHIVITKYDYDDLGRVLTLKKTVSSTINGVAVNKPEQTISQNEYDRLGQLKTKKLAPTFNSNAGIETLTYDYNIRGWMLGMNRNYITGSASNYFGFELGYDKTTTSVNPTGDANPQFNGNIGVKVWRSKGDGMKRVYDFFYDNASRLTQASYLQSAGGVSWNRDMDFSTTGLDSDNGYRIKYDNNGNILGMMNFGAKLSNPGAVIDAMHYTYQANSNKLQKVYDDYSDANTKLGDFHDGANGTNDDYDYDANGNLIEDNNKNIYSVTYNHLNLPSVITVAGKGYITYTYDAAGNKLAKETIDYTVNPAKVNTTLYIGAAVYENYVLQFIKHEEGRIRLNTTNNTLQYDYMLKDHLGNVRMVLTEELKQDKYPVASLEDAKVNTEDDYYTIDNSKIVLANTVTNLPTYTNGDNGIGNNPADATFDAANSAKLYKLNSSTNKMGLGVTLKIMSGDRIDIHGKSYWFDNNTGGSGANAAPVVLDLLSGMMGAPTGATSGGHTTATELNGISDVTTPVGNFIGNSSRDDAGYPQRPKAFINYLFFDEQFRYVSGGFSAVNNTPGLKSHFSELQNLTASKNGYVYIYVSNESPVNVFFDNLQVVHTRGPILEETHYYPFGLTMAGVSSKALSFGEPGNKLKYNGKEEQRKEFSDGSGLEWTDFGARMYDNQLGRWMNVDPKAHQFTWQSQYCAMDNDPINKIDPDGQSGEPVIDKKNKTVTVHSNFIFYGSKADAKLSKATANEIASQYNGANGKTTIDGVEYTVKFNITYQTVTEAEATKMAEGNTDVKNNFIRVEKNNTRMGRSFNEIGENNGFMNTDDNLGTSTTAPHEVGHGYGLTHSSNDQRGSGQPDIMAARGTLVDPAYQYDPKAAAGAAAGGTINPAKRKVTQANITDMFKSVTFDKSGKGKIGTATNKIYDVNGYEKKKTP
jgi:RHS repeat-associated protein